MKLSEPTQEGFYLLGALAHLGLQKEVKVHGLMQVHAWITQHWNIECKLIELVRSRPWLLENELIEERPLGYSVTDLGLEYLKYKQPRFMLSNLLCDEKSD